MPSFNLLYYSINTSIAHYINEQYYGQSHYVWCSPVFNPANEAKYSPFSRIGTTSSPHDIYCDLKRVIATRDTHSSKIRENRLGLKLGAKKQWEAGVINEKQYGDIITLIDKAETADFAPFIYLIRKDLVDSKIEEVPVKETANPFGKEYRIFDLKHSEFEIIEIDPK